MNIKVIDKDGDWLHHNGEYPLNHFQRSLMLQPATVYKIKQDAWTKEQVVLVETDDPMGAGESKAKPAKAAKPEEAAK